MYIYVVPSLERMLKILENNLIEGIFSSVRRISFETESDLTKDSEEAIFICTEFRIISTRDAKIRFETRTNENFTNLFLIDEQRRRVSK